MSDDVGWLELLRCFHLLMGIIKVHCNGHHKGLGSGKRKTTWRICSFGNSLAHSQSSSGNEEAFLKDKEWEDMKIY